MEKTNNYRYYGYTKQKVSSDLCLIFNLNDIAYGVYTDFLSEIRNLENEGIEFDFIFDKFKREILTTKLSIKREQDELNFINTNLVDMPNGESLKLTDLKYQHNDKFYNFCLYENNGKYFFTSNEIYDKLVFEFCISDCDNGLIKKYGVKICDLYYYLSCNLGIELIKI